MDFASDQQKAVYERISPMMKELYGEFVHHDENNPVFFLRFGSAGVLVSVSPFRDDAVVTATSLLVTDVELTLDLAKHLLGENATLFCGAFAFDEQGVWFRYAVLGSVCDKPELSNLVAFVANIADEYDDQLVARFGGKRPGG